MSALHDPMSVEQRLCRRWLHPEAYEARISGRHLQCNALLYMYALNVSLAASDTPAMATINTLFCPHVHFYNACYALNEPACGTYIPTEVAAPGKIYSKINTALLPMQSPCSA